MIQKDPLFPQLVKTSPTGRLRRIDTAPGLLIKKMPIAVVLSIAPPIAELVVSPDKIDVGLIQIHYLHSLNITCGFLFEMPRLKVKIASRYIKIYRPDYADSDMFTNVKVMFTNEYFTVLNANDTATLLTLNTRQLINVTQERTDVA